MSLRDMMVYVAGPITKGLIMENMRQAHAAGVLLVQKGFSVFVPHASCFWGHQVTECGTGVAPGAEVDGVHYETWMEMDFAVIRKCSMLLRLPGESAGADREVEYAQQIGVPVFHSIEELVNWVNDGYKDEDR